MKSNSLSTASAPDWVAAGVPAGRSAREAVAVPALGAAGAAGDAALLGGAEAALSSGSVARSTGRALDLLREACRGASG
eukprot:10586720-Heterocapsa_arctica.AAC.1